MNFRSLVTPVFSAVVASVTAFVLLVIFAAHEQDSFSLKSEKAVLAQQIENVTNSLAVLVSDNAWWDTAVEKIITTQDLAWIDSTIGTTTTDIDSVDGAVVIDTDFSVIYAAHVASSSPSVSPAGLLASDVHEPLAALTTNTDPKRLLQGLVTVNGALVSYGASQIRPTSSNDMTRKERPTRPILLFYAVLNEAEVKRIGTGNAIDGLRFVTKQPGGTGFLRLEGPGDSDLGWLVWNTHRPGTKMALDMVMPSIILLTIVIYAMVRFVRRANVLVAGLEQASRSKSAFLASMSHEVRTPLNSILGFAELISLELFGKVEGKKNKEYLKLIKDSGSHLLAIINDILDISKLEAGKFEVYAEKIDPEVVITDCINMVKPSTQDKHITVTHHCQRTTLYSDERILRQILINILSNAIKFTNQGGSVHVAGERLQDHYQILVSDNGIGMSKEEIEIALSTFGQVQNKLTQNTYTKGGSGTGLGLPLVKRFVDLLDGTITITSNPGKGTSVIMLFPYRIEAKSL